MSQPHDTGNESVPRTDRPTDPNPSNDHDLNVDARTGTGNGEDTQAGMLLRRQTLLALLDASRAMATELQIPAVLQRMAQQASLVFRCQGASVLLYDQPHHELVFLAATGPESDKLLDMRFDASLGIAGHALRLGKAVLVDDVQGHEHFFEGVDAKTHLKTRSLMACPLIHAGKALGVIEVLNPLDYEHFNSEDLQLLEIFANMAAVAVNNARSFESLDHQNQALKQSQRKHPIVGDGPSMTAVKDLCRAVAATSTTVLLTGETGTGKEMAAREIHHLSPRKNQPFVAINCAAVAESLLESELFGHEKGAFTGASSQRQGRFELASGGTLLLDEIGEMSPNLQVKLLRVLQERCYERVGGSQTLTTDVRIIAATNRDLRVQINKGQFREDLYYRLAVFPIHLPPLRQRIEDLQALSDIILADLCPSLGLARATISTDALQAMRQYAWPGNVRELRNVIERSALLSKGRITLDWLPMELKQAAAGVNPANSDRDTHSKPQDRQGRPYDGDRPSLTDKEYPGSLKSSDATGGLAGGKAGVSASDHDHSPRSGRKLIDHERALLLEALHEHNWNRSAAARALGITRDVLRYRIKKHGLKQA